MEDKTVNIININSNIFQYQDYSESVDSLITNSVLQDVEFDPSIDYIEYYVFDLNQNILFSNVAGYPNYRLIDNIVTIDPQNDLELRGYTEGSYYTLYNFLKRKLSSNVSSTFYIQEISTDRTELRLNTTKISNTDVVDLTNQFINEIQINNNAYLDFYLNFGNNKLIIANNIALDNTNPEDPTVLIKLYEALPLEFDINSQCWVVEQVAESQAYQISLTKVFNPNSQLDYISGPNFNLDIQDQINNSTSYINQNYLTQNSSLLGSGSLLYQINSLLIEKGIEINIDYSDFSNFIHFSSAQTRLENFYYKLSLIEQYTYNANLTSAPSNYYISGSQIVWQNKINEIITNFDGYEYYLYYESGSTCWPKSNSVYPYTNVLTTSPQGLNWFNSQSIVAGQYDLENYDGLVYSIPTYIYEDSDNDQYKLFVQMIGQHFDNIWLYLKDITNKFDNDNRLNYGISKDIVAQAIRDLGVKIYQNNFSSNDLYSALLGITPTGDLLNIPYATSSLPTPPGYEYIDTFITASSTGSLEPVDDINKEIYKRIYHNLPMLLKKKGTTEGLRMLVNVYGIPDTILRINEFGGKSYENQSWDNFVDQFNYAFTTPGTGYVSVSLSTAYFDGTKDLNSIEFRFKTFGIPNSTEYSQSIARITNNTFELVLEYTGSGLSSGSYSGSIPNNYNQYATLKYIETANPSNSSSVYLPFYNGEWWSVLLTQNTSSNLTTLYAKNNIYDGYDGSQLGFQSSSSITTAGIWVGGVTKALRLGNDTNLTVSGKTYTPFSGSYQELRFYHNILEEKKFDDYVMNPYSIEGNSTEGADDAFNQLFFRAPLGTVLDNDTTLTVRNSIHPSYTQYPVTQSFGTTNTYRLFSPFTFEPNTETLYQNQFIAGIKNSVSEKIRIVNQIVPTGNTLSQYISIQQNSPSNETFTKDVNYLEAAFSPQDEINDDIIAQLGYFNIGSYIGDPRQLILSSSNYYSDFNKLRDNYFSKYTHNYDLNDYIRLIKFFDNSLFKMIKDFTPSRAGLASGLVIKPTLLERYKYPQPRVNTQSSIAFVGSPTSKTFNIPY
jgi:hypothetical protein